MFDEGEEFSYGKVIIEEITYDEYQLKNGVNVIVDLKLNDAVRKYCLLEFSYYDRNDKKIPIEITDLEYSISTRNRYSGGMTLEVCEFCVKIETYINKHYMKAFIQTTKFGHFKLVVVYHNAMTSRIV